MDTNFVIVERLVSDFESGASIQSSLDEINLNEDLLQSWGYENFANWDFFFVASEEEIFVTNDDLLDYFDKEDLVNLNEEEILDWIENRLEELASEDTIPTIHYADVSNSIVVVWGETWGQAGVHFDDMMVKKNLGDLCETLIQQGYIFSSSEKYRYPSELLISKYQKHIIKRLE